MVESSRPRDPAVAAAEDQRVGRPSQMLRPAQCSTQIVRIDRSLETMQDEQAWSTLGIGPRIDAMHLELIVIGRCPVLDASQQCWRPSKKLAPERPKVSARYPPCGAIGILAVP